MIRRFGAVPVKGQVYRRRPGVYAVLIGVGPRSGPRSGRRVLLTRQADPGPEYQLPGGGVEPGEHPLAALHREVFEETGWLIAGARRLGAFRRFAFMPDYDLWAEKLCTIYAARPLRRLGPPTEAGHSAHWMTPNQALRCVGNPGDAHFLAQALVYPSRMHGNRRAGGLPLPPGIGTTDQRRRFAPKNSCAPAPR